MSEYKSYDYDNNISNNDLLPNRLPCYKYEKHSFPRSSSPNEITQSWLNQQLEKTLTNLSLIETKLTLLNDDPSYNHNDNHTDNYNNDNDGNDYDYEHEYDDDTYETEKEKQQQQKNLQSKMIGFRDIPKLNLTVEYLSLAHDYLSISSSSTPNTSTAAANNDTAAANNDTATSIDNRKNVPQMIQILKQLVQILTSHPPPSSASSSSESKKYEILYNGIQERFECILNHVKARCLLELKKYIYQYNFPSVTSSSSSSSSLSFSERKHNNDEHDDDEHDSLSIETKSESIIYLITTLFNILLWKDSISNHLLSSYSSTTSSSYDQMDTWNRVIGPVVHEFMRPIVQRVQYHFISNDDNPNHNTTDNNDNDASTASASSLSDEVTKRPYKLIEWVCIYIKDIINSQEMIMVWKWMQDIVSDIHVTTTTTTTTTTTNHIPSSSSSPPLDVPSPLRIRSYFINEMNNLIRYVLYKRNYFHHLKNASLVSTSMDVTFHPGVVCNAIECILKYDEFIMDHLNEVVDYQHDDDDEEEEENTQKEKHGMDMIYTLTDTVICNDTSFFHWWLECEKDNALQTLKEQKENCMLSNNTHINKDEEGSNTGSDINALCILMPCTEAFLALLYGFQSKMSLMTRTHNLHTGRRTGTNNKRLFVQKVEVPTCMEFMEIMHEKASMLRKEMLPQRRRNGNLPPNDIELQSNIQKWISVITGTQLAATCLYKNASSSRPNDRPNDNDNNNNDDDNMHVERKRIATSLEKLGEAMVEELSASFVENLLMERTKFASYLMQCVYTLSSDDAMLYTHTHTNDQPSTTDNNISPQLTEVAHLLHVLCRVCRDAMIKAHEIPISRDEKSTTTTTVTNILDEGKDEPDYHAVETKMNLVENIPLKILKNISQRVEEKFLDIALDYNNMIPELNITGCTYFSHDVEHIANVFRISIVDKGSQEDGALALNTFNRLKDVTKLMAMEDGKFKSLCNAIRMLLAEPLLDSLENNYNVHPVIIDELEEDGTLYNEAQSMILAQGFQYLNLRDAINVMNRRRINDTGTKEVDTS